jgi:hypothetical protein
MVSEAHQVDADKASSSNPAATPSCSRVVRITDGLLQAVCEFLHREWRNDISVETWRSQIQHPWLPEDADYGVALVHPNEGIVGVLVAFYSDQIIDGRVERFGNLAHYYVKPAYRSESLDLLFALMAPEHHTLTSLSPIRESVKIACTLGWTIIDEYVYLIPNLAFTVGTRKLSVLTSFDDIVARVDDRHKNIMSDHGEAFPGRYVLVSDGDRWCLSIHKRDIRKGIPFSVPVYLSDHFLFRQWIARFLCAYRSLDGCWVTLCQQRLLVRPPMIGLRLRDPRPYMFRSTTVAPAQVTALYSEVLR